MFVKFARALGSWEQGKLYEVESEIAQDFVKRGFATEVPASEFLTASRAAQDTALREDIMRSVGDSITKALADFGKQRGFQGPPNGGGRVNFDRISEGTDRAEEENKRAIKQQNLGELLRTIGVISRPEFFGADPAYQQHCARRIRSLSGTATEYKFDSTTGQHTFVQERDLDGGGIETITRTGTDSLSGGATYGFALKPEYLQNVFEISMEQQVFANATTQIPVGQGNEVRWPAWDQYRPPVTNSQGTIQSAVFAGIQLYYLGEITQRIASDALLNSINFKTVDLTAFTAFSRDFVVDNYLAFDSAVVRMIGRAFGWMEDYMSIQGPGVGKPQGYFNAGCALSVARGTGSKIQANDLTAMLAAASPMVWNELRWITNITTIPQLAFLQQGSTYVFQPNALISQAMQLSIQDRSVGGQGAELMHRPMGSLLGFPVYFSEKVPTLGNFGDLSLVAPRQYGYAKRSGLEVAVSEHFFFDTDRIAYRLKQRHDGRMLWRAPYQQADGSTTSVSPIIILK
jgi:HK97 family phage major capsid protein